MREDNRKGESGAGGSRTAPTRVGHTAYNGRPQGSPLQGKDGRVGEGGWVPASARATGGGVGGGRFPNRPYEGLVAQSYHEATTRVAPTEGMGGDGGWVPAFAMTTGKGKGHSPPSPIFTSAGSNLAPSWGKGFVGAERAIFVVIKGGDLGRQLRHGRYQLLQVLFVVEGVGGSSDAGELRHLTYNNAVIVPQSTHCLIRRNAFYLEGG